MKQYILICILGLSAIACGSGNSGSSNRQVLFDLGSSDNALADISTTSLLTRYQVDLYASVDGTQASTPSITVVAEASSDDENLLSSVLTSIADGEYFVSLSVIYDITQTVGGTTTTTSLILLSKTQAVSLVGGTVTVDLSDSDWNEDYDEDSDGATNLDEVNQGSDPLDSDTDDDGLVDGSDACPSDATESSDLDGDGTCDNSDNDIDGDNLTNAAEVALGTSSTDADSDDDTVQDDVDNCGLVANANQLDTDSDDSGDSCDADDDNDGLTDAEELVAGADGFITNPLLADTDLDGVDDATDALPSNESETLDNDNDGIGNITDTDDDNDGKSDSEEVNTLFSNPLSADTDSDGVDDGTDNCILISNAIQTDTDSDDNGDDCDDDDDNDNLSDVEELARGSDGFVTNSLDADDDGDGVDDDIDNCPNFANADQIDADGDGFGAADYSCDCDDNDSTYNALAADHPDHLVQDTNCDGIDGNRYAAIFVDDDGAASAASSSMTSPTNDLSGALQLAQTNGYEVYVAAGDYDTSTVNFLSGVSIYGGYETGFDDREVYHDTNVTNFTQVTISDLNDPITLAGIVFESQSSSSTQTLVSISNADVTLENDLLTGNSAASVETLLSVQDAEINLKANSFVGAASSTATAIAADSSTGFVTNNIFDMNDADHTVGIDLIDSDLVIVNNTIDGGRHDDGNAYGIQLNHSSPIVVNNIFVTRNNIEQSSIRCTGIAPASTITLENNIFLRYSDDLTFAAYITCSGHHHLTTNASLEANATELAADNNFVDSVIDVTNLDSLLDSSSYELLESTADNYIAGQDTSAVGFGTVILDFAGNTRAAYDVGAFEFF